MTVERRNVYTGYLCNFMKESIFAPSLNLCTVVQRDNINSYVLALAQREKVNIVRQGLWIKGTNTTGKYNILEIMAVFAV